MAPVTGDTEHYLVVDSRPGGSLFVFLDRDPAADGRGGPAGRPVRLDLLPPRERFGRLCHPVVGQSLEAGGEFREFASPVDLREAGFVPVPGYWVCHEWDDYQAPWEAPPPAADRPAVLAADRPALPAVPQAPRPDDTVRAAGTADTAPTPVELPTTRVFGGPDGRDDAGSAGLDPGDLVRAVIRVCLLGAADPVGGDSADLFSRFPVEAGREALAGRLAWFARRRAASLGPVRGGTCRLSVPASGGWSDRLLGGADPVELVVTLPPRRQTGRGEVTAAALGCAGGGPKRHALGVELLARLRAALMSGPDNRGGVRYPADLPVVVYPVDHRGGVGAGVEGRCLDLSAGGARVESAAEVASGWLYLRFPEHPTAIRVGVLCEVVRQQWAAPGRSVLGLRFPLG